MTVEEIVNSYEYQTVVNDYRLQCLWFADPSKMAVTGFQTEILRRIARLRIDGGETYIAGGLALNHQLKRPRLSSVFHEGTLGGVWPRIIG